MSRRTDSKRSSQGSHKQCESLPLWPDPVQGNRLVAMLQRHVNDLRGDAEHGNRRLFLDDVFIAYLLAFFNPTLRTLRTIEDFSQTQQAQKHLSIGRICKSTLSDFNRLVDPERLQPILLALRAAVHRKQVQQRTAENLHEALQQVLAVDGTFISLAADVGWVIIARNQLGVEAPHGRLDFHVDVATWLPEVVVVGEAGESEAATAARTVTPGAIHLYDRGIFGFDLVSAHFRRQNDGWERQADFVMRVRGPGERCPNFEARDERQLSKTARAAGIVSDRLGHFSGSTHRAAVDLPLREIILPLPDGSLLRLVTTLLDVPPEVVTELYRQRWQIELFFRWLKCYANFDHLISHSRQGVLLNFYVVVIGVLLLYLHTGSRPNKYLFSLLSVVAQGGGSLEEILPILRERMRQCERDRQTAARRRARKQAKSR